MFHFKKYIYPVGLTYPMFHFPQTHLTYPYFFSKNGTLEHSLFFKDLPTTLLEQYRTLQNIIRLATSRHFPPRLAKLATHG